jgi:hypothetical protein
VARIALAPPPATIRPSIAYAAAAAALLLGLAALIAGAPRGDIVALSFGAVFTIVGTLLIWAVRRDARRVAPALALEGDVLRLDAKRLQLGMPVADVAEVVVDVEGVACGADRLRFPASGSPSEQRYLYGKRGGTALRRVPARGEPNLAVVLRAGTGIAVTVRDPHAAAKALRGSLPVRVVEHYAAPDPELVEIAGSELRVLRRGEYAAALAAIFLVAFGQALLPEHALAGALLMLGALAGGLLLARRRRVRRLS